MFDTHSHKTGKIKLILAGSEMSDSEKNILKAKDNNNVWAAVGIHPQVEVENIDKTIDKLDKLIANNKEWVVAVGECGLDYSESKTENQERLFRGQIALALKYDLPLIIHARKAVDEVIEILASYKNTRGVFHCFAGGKKRVAKVLALGENWYFGIDGNLTYEVGLEEVVKIIQKDRLVLETDSPYLTPEPHRGEENKPEYVKFVYKKTAEVWGLSFDRTEKIIDKNATKLFGLGSQSK